MFAYDATGNTGRLFIGHVIHKKKQERRTHLSLFGSDKESIASDVISLHMKDNTDDIRLECVFN